MALKKSELYSSLWQSCDELRGGMDASQYKDYVLVLLFIKYVSDKYAGQRYAPITIPPGASFADMVALKGKSDIGDQINKKIIAPLANVNKLSGFPDFNDAAKLGSGKEKVDRLTNLVAIFENPALDFSKNRADDDDILGDAYEYLMRHFATESGKSKGQFYTPAEVSRIMAQISGIRDAETSASTTVYDPTCGSGSLLLKVGDEAGTAVTLYGQEKDEATSGLARMNMILHNNPTALIAQGNTLANPKFKDGDTLKTFDYVVANPPFSDKRWSNGLDPLNDPFERFKSFGVPPTRQGDYAYLLHIVRSLKSTGKGACILPHGVLFRGNAETDIRRALVRKGYINGIIGLPANLFYGTGIRACIVVVDKEDTQARRGIFMIDASRGFMKGGPKNRLRSRDIHRIVDVFNKRLDVPKYARMVPFDEIEENEFNLNLPRYIDSQTPEDLQDIEGHLRGGIPASDVDALGRYWAVYPQLRNTLFKESRPGYVDLALEKPDIKSAIYEHPEFTSFVADMNAHFAVWRQKSAARLKALQADCHPKEVITALAEGLLAHYAGKSLIDPYDIYQHLMDYWAETMQDDCYLIAADGWKADTTRILVKDKKGKERDRGWTCDLIPKTLIVARYLANEQVGIDQLAAELEDLTAKTTELEGEHGGDEGILCTVANKTDALAARNEALEAVWSGLDPGGYAEFREAIALREANALRVAELRDDSRLQALRNSRGNVTKAAVSNRAKTSLDSAERNILKDYLALTKAERDSAKEANRLFEEAKKEINLLLQRDPDNEELGELRVLNQWLKLDGDKANLKKRLKEAKAALDSQAYARYPRLTVSEIKTLVVVDKWLAALESAIHGEMDRLSRQLTQRVKELVERYEMPLPQMAERVAELEVKVSRHLEKMGFSWK
jgi:type I restriction enzyme M protein